MRNLAERFIYLVKFVIGTLILLYSPVWGNDIQNNISLQEFDNIGFMANSVAPLKEKFPMCDTFLNVNWIDKEKKIGHSKYDVYRDGKKKGMIWALVYLNQKYPRFDYDLLKYKREGKLQEIFDFIREGEISEIDQSLLQIYIGKRAITFHPTKLSIPEDVSLSDNRQNVCIPYPDNDRVWIVEGQRVGKIYNNMAIQKKYQNISNDLLTVPYELFLKHDVVDLNNDGIDDYFAGGRIAGGSVIYSFNNRYYHNIREIYSRGEGGFFNWKFPSTGKNCMTYSHGYQYITTDGSDYFLSNQCNISDMIKQ